MAAGLPGRLLLPAHWGELYDGLDRGLAGAQSVDWPYDGADPWVRLTIAARRARAAHGRRPCSRSGPRAAARRALRAAGLVALLLLYGTAVAERDPGQPAAARAGRCSCSSPPGCGCRGCRAARRSWPARVVASVGRALAARRGRARQRPRLVGLPRLDLVREAARSSRSTGTTPTARSNWSRAGDDAAEREVGPPAVLEGRDARRLRRLPLDPHERPERHAATAPRSPTRSRGSRASWDYGEYNLDWDKRIRVTVRSLSTPFVIGAGVILRVDGVAARTDGRRHHAADRHRPAREGRHLLGARLRAEPDAEADAGVAQGLLREPGARTRRSRSRTPASPRSTSWPAGDARSARRRAAGASRSSSRFATATRRTGGRAPTGCSAAPPTRRCTRGARADPRRAHDLRRGEERRAVAPGQLHLLRARAHARRAARWASSSRTSAATASSSPATMALMLRMAGIPARVAAGFSPGLLQQGHARVPRARPRRPLLGRGVVHRDRLGAVRPDAGALAGAVAVERARHERRRRRRRRGHGSRARARRRPSTRPAATAGGGDGRRQLDRCPRCSCSLVAAAARGWAP